QDDSLAVFVRDAGTGALAFVERKRDSVDAVTGLVGVSAVAVSSDGTNVYATGTNGIAIFLRDASSGSLTFMGADTGLKSPQALTLSPDGSHLYAASSSNNAVAAFTRDPSTGMLTLVQTVQDNTAGVDGLAGATALAVSPDGAHVYVAGKLDDAIAVFSRDASTGTLSFIELERHAVNGASGLDRMQGHAAST